MRANYQGHLSWVLQQEKKVAMKNIQEKADEAPVKTMRLDDNFVPDSREVNIKKW